MSEGPLTSSRRKPSRSFASYPLHGAVEGIKRAGASGSDHSRDAFAAYLGHETINSGGFKRKLASIKDWGLVETRPDRVVITDLGMRIAHPRTDEDEKTAVREAFLQAELFAATYTSLAKQVDLSQERIGNMGVHEHGISPGAKVEFARSFVESAVFAGLGKQNPDGSVRLWEDSEDLGGPSATGEPREQHSMQTSREGDANPQRRVIETASDLPPTVHQRWVMKGGSAVFELRLDGPLPSTAFSTLADVVQAVETLVSSIGQREDETLTTTAGEAVEASD